MINIFQNVKTNTTPVAAGGRLNIFANTQPTTSFPKQSPLLADQNSTSLPEGATQLKLSSGNFAYTTPSGSTHEILPDGNKRVTLDKQFGGGVYTINSKNPGQVVNTGHTTYGGEKSQAGQQRDDIIPVGLGGVNASPDNIRMEKDLPTNQQSQFVHTPTDALEGQLAKDVKSGRTPLQQARATIIDTKQNQSNPPVSQSLTGNFGRALLDDAKIAAELPMGLYNMYAKPSDTTIAAEKQMGLSDMGNQHQDTITAPLRGVGRIIMRTFSPLVEPYATLLGTAAGQEHLANQVAAGKLPKDVLNKLPDGKLTPEEYTNVFIASASLGLVLAPFLKGPAIDATLKLSKIAETKYNVTITKTELADIVRGRPDLVDPVKVEAFSKAGSTPEGNNYVQQLKKGYIEIAKSNPNVLSNVLKNAATRPLSDVLNIGKTFGVDTSVPKTRLIGSDIQGGTLPSQVSALAENGFPKTNPLLQNTASVPAIASGTATLNPNGFPTQSPVIESKPLPAPITAPQEAIKPNPLHQEALKYKSADEFVKAQPTLYHGGSADIKDIQLGKSNFQKTFYMSENPEYAKSFGGNKSTLNEIALDSSAKMADLRKPSDSLIKQIEAKIAPKETGKIIKIKKPDGTFVDIPEKIGGKINAVFSTDEIIQGLKDGKAHFAELPEVKQALKELEYDGAITQESKFGTNYGIWNKNIVKTKSQLTDIWNKAQEKPTEAKLVEPTENKTSGVAKSIDAKAIEQGFTSKGYDNLAGYDGTSFKEQAQLLEQHAKIATPEINRAITRGEIPLPTGIRSAPFLSYAEDIARSTKDAGLMQDLANSPLATKISEGASETSLARMREKDSATARLQEIKKAKEARSAIRIKDSARKAFKSLPKETTKMNLTKEEASWDKFLEDIKC